MAIALKLKPEIISDSQSAKCNKDYNKVMRYHNAE